MALYEGGCECGSVRFLMRDEPIFVNCCHCRQCQKITGSAFAINAMIESDRLEVSSEDRHTPAPGKQVRCNRCATLLWSEHGQFGERIKFVRVGTLDEAERIEPDAHFFVRSKHPWVVIPPGLPQFETLPTDRDRPLMNSEAAARLAAARSV